MKSKHWPGRLIVALVLALVLLVGTAVAAAASPDGWRWTGPTYVAGYRWTSG
jgi:hypothetical protein